MSLIVFPSTSALMQKAQINLKNISVPNNKPKNNKTTKIRPSPKSKKCYINIFQP